MLAAIQTGEYQQADAEIKFTVSGGGKASRGSFIAQVMQQLLQQVDVRSVERDEDNHECTVKVRFMALCQDEDKNTAQ